MSLECCECHRTLGPSNLPGSEGTLVYPNLITFVWNSNQSPEGRLKLVHCEVRDNRSLCFRCIQDALPNERHSHLQTVFEAFEAEARYRRLEKAQKNRWVTSEERQPYSEALKAFCTKNDEIDKSNCLFCGRQLPEKMQPFFRAIGLDRIACSQHLGHFPGDIPFYQWSHFETGDVSFRICYDCFTRCFPRSFDQLGYDIRQERNPENKNVSTFTFSPEVYQALKEEIGVEKAKKMIIDLGASIHPLTQE